MQIDLPDFFPGPESFERCDLFTERADDALAEAEDEGLPEKREAASAGAASQGPGL